MYVLDSDVDTPILDPETIKDQNHRIMEDSSNVATAFMSLWEPRLLTTSDNSVESTSTAGLFSGPRGEIFSSILRIISPKDILESYDAAVKGVCLVPTQMNKIYCQVNKCLQSFSCPITEKGICRDQCQPISPLLFYYSQKKQSYRKYIFFIS